MRAAAIIPADLDGELSQQLQKLSKRDATTKLKALQVWQGHGPAKGREAYPQCMHGDGVHAAEHPAGKHSRRREAALRLGNL